MAGRPSSYNPEIAQLICQRLANGEALSVICRDESMPCRDTVANWADKNPEFSAQCARARILQADFMDEKILDVTEKVVTGEIASDVGRVAIGSYQWRAARLNPKLYGDAMTLKGDKENPLEIGLAGLLDAAMSKRQALAERERVTIDADAVEVLPDAEK